MGNVANSFGKYPKEYNPRIHGPYDPARFYGKADTAFGEVKLGELPAWLARRNMSAGGTVALISRGYNRWARSGIQAQRPSFAPVVQVFVLIAVFECWVHYNKVRNSRNSKYH